MTEPLDWTINIRDIGDRGLTAQSSATETQRRQLALDLDLVACDRLVADYVVKPLAGDRYRLRGTVEADVTQACVVTLEPIPTRLAEPFDIELRPGGENSGAEEEGGPGDEHEILSSPDTDTIENGVIELGRIAYEIVAAALDPYPRKDGADFNWTDPRAQAGETEGHPFAALAKLKKGG